MAKDGDNGARGRGRRCSETGMTVCVAGATVLGDRDDGGQRRKSSPVKSGVTMDLSLFDAETAAYLVRGYSFSREWAFPVAVPDCLALFPNPISKICTFSVREQIYSRLRPFM